MVDFSRIRTFKGHEDVVNSLDVSYNGIGDENSASFATGLACDMLASGSNDGTVKLWDFRERRFSASFIVNY